MSPFYSSAWPGKRQEVVDNGDPAKCCNVCSAHGPYSNLDILKPMRWQNRKRPADVRSIGENLKKELRSKLIERDKILNENPMYRMIGVNFLCRDSILEQLCERASYTTAAEHLDIFCLHAQFRDRFYNVVVHCVLGASPPAPKSRRK